MKHFCSFLLLIVIVIPSLGQSNREKLKKFEREGKWKEAINLLQGEANKGEVWAQNSIGVYYWNLGEMPACISWFKKAAEKQNTDALFNLGLIYDANQNKKTPNIIKNNELAKKYYLSAIASVERDTVKYWAVINYCLILRKSENKRDEAIDFLRKYINQDVFYEVQHYLCELLMENKYQYREAINIYRKLAEKNDLYSMFWLGNEYLSGKKLEKDLEQAIKWFTLVSESNDVYYDMWGSQKGRAKRRLAQIYEELYRKYRSEKYLRLALKWCSRNYGELFSDNVLERLYNDGVYHAQEYKDFDSWCAFIVKRFSFDSDVDYNIPNVEQTNSNTWVLIVANEHYELESPVLYAENDGRIFAKYCTSALGIPQSNVTYVTDCSLNKMKYEIDMLIQKGLLNPESKIILYYAGHGIPADNLSTAYLLPVDGYARNTSTGLDIGNLYHQLGNSGVPSIILLDACFSGTQRDGNMMVSSRGVAIKPKEQMLSGNVVVMSACKGDETAQQYSDQQHGLFTYYLLKKIQESQGNCTLGELESYLKTKVQSQSIAINGKSQTPSVRVSFPPVKRFNKSPTFTLNEVPLTIKSPSADTVTCFAVKLTSKLTSNGAFSDISIGASGTFISWL